MENNRKKNENNKDEFHLHAVITELSGCMDRDNTSPVCHGFDMHTMNGDILACVSSHLNGMRPTSWFHIFVKSTSSLWITPMVGKKITYQISELCIHYPLILYHISWYLTLYVIVVCAPEQYKLHVHFLSEFINRTKISRNFHSCGCFFFPFFFTFVGFG